MHGIKAISQILNAWPVFTDYHKGPLLIYTSFFFAVTRTYEPLVIHKNLEWEKKKPAMCMSY